MSDPIDTTARLIEQHHVTGWPECDMDIRVSPTTILPIGPYVPPPPSAPPPPMPVIPMVVAPVSGREIADGFYTVVGDTVRTGLRLSMFLCAIPALVVLGIFVYGFILGVSGHPVGH